MPKLLKDLSRELRHVEKNSNMIISSSPATIPTPATNITKDAKVETSPPKRIRRKPKARADFVDINEALSNFAAEEVRKYLQLVVAL